MGDTALYRPILKKAWQITTKFKTLWFFGLFAAILSSGGEFELLSRVLFNSKGRGESIMRGIIDNFKLGLESSLSSGESVWSNAWTSITSSPADILLALLILIVTIAIVVFVIWLAVVSQVGLIRNISLNNKNKQTTINDGIDEGVNKFWPILIVNVVYKLILLVIFVLLGKEILLLAKIGSAGVILHIISLLIFSIVVIVISFLVRYQIIFMVIKGEKTVDALKSSYNLFKENWLVSIEMAFILFVVYVIAAYLTAILTSIFLAVPLVFVTYSNQIPVFVIITIGLLSISAVFVITFLITAVLSTFQWASWTLLFDQINSNKTVAKIARLSERSPNVRIPFKK